MIVVTGSAGFIGSCMVWQLNQQGLTDILVVDDLGTGPKWKNISKRNFSHVVSISDFLSNLDQYGDAIEGIIHMGACSTTTEIDADYLMKNNVLYSMSLFRFCTEKKIPFIYASSAATYGDGALGYDDLNTGNDKLLPINKYGFSKHVFDRWVLSQTKTPPFWAGLKFFNVYGPQEYHKGSQASVVYHAFPQVRDHKCLKLFKSYKPEYQHGEQKRDFIYVKDVTKVMAHFWNSPKPERSGIYNVGTGVARSFSDLGRAVFSSFGINEADFEWIDMPESLQKQYQYFTEATLEKLKSIGGYQDDFYSLEVGVQDYVNNYLNQEDSYL